MGQITPVCMDPACMPANPKSILLLGYQSVDSDHAQRSWKETAKLSRGAAEVNG